MTNYDRAIDAALHGPEVKKLKVHDHEFNVKPVRRERNGSTLIVRGQISHCLARRKDDQVYYTIAIKDGRVIDVQKTTQEGNTLESLFKWNHLIGSAIIGIFNAPLGAVLGAATPALTAAVEAAENAGIGNWRQACDTIISVIAVALTEEAPAPGPSPIPRPPVRPGPGRRPVTP